MTIILPTIIGINNINANEARKTHYLLLGVNHVTNVQKGLRGCLPQVNNISFKIPSSPPLTQYNDTNLSAYCIFDDPLTWPRNCSINQCSCTQVIEADLNEVVELFFYAPRNRTMSCHPMHLHGFTSSVVGMGRLDQNHSMSIEDIRNLDQAGHFPRRKTDKPVRKDTFCVSHRSYMIIQFRADNPGWWFLHCHLDFHALASTI
ncbi:laccase-type phenoloxidase [Apostichopus japonicus]|uniref:Laccase-type phenoloxidase n=1 Tax=Stichopus japonicus TaxID=307972 RepID=A0A2G8K5U7_STIJA|nr:laccase-type phenoloxidase [Apostichopus japonicus]